MHEYRVAQDITNRAVREAMQRNANGVAAIQIALGTQALIDPEALALGIKVASLGTVAEDADIRVHRVQGCGVALESLELLADGPEALPSSAPAWEE